MRLWVAVAGVVLALPARAILLTFETPDDLASLNFTRPAGISPSTFFSTAPGVDSSQALVSLPANTNYVAVLPSAVEHGVDGVRTVCLDFYLPDLKLTDTAICEVGLTDAVTSGLGGRGGGSTQLAISGVITNGNGGFWANFGLIAFDDTSGGVNKYFNDTTITLSPNRWYQLSFSELVTSDVVHVWGLIDDIGLDGTATPTAVYSVDQAHGMSFPASLFNQDTLYGAFASRNTTPVDNFATPEPAPSIMAVVALLPLLGQQRRRRRAACGNS